MAFTPVRKIDTHLHLSLHPAPGTGKMHISSAGEMLPHLEELGIGKGILMSSGENAPSWNNEENRAVAEMYPDRYAWMCNLDPVAPETVYDRLKACRDQGAVGIGELMINKPLDDPFLEAVFDAAGKLDLPVTFHMSPEVGFGYGVVDGPGLPLLEKALQKFPDTKFVGHSQCFWIEISGDAPGDRDGRNSWGSGPVMPGGRVPELFARYSNLYGDLSANSAGQAIMRDPAFGLRFLETYADRLFFATDMVNVDMVFPLGAWLDARAGSGELPEDVYRKICRDNARRVYGV